jgi:hypothetical protein
MAEKIEARITGKSLDGPVTELEHFDKCPVCGGVFDMRDLRQVFEHWHDGPEESAENL